MKIALIMTGQSRLMWLAAPSLYKYVIDQNDADVFLYLNRGSIIPTVPVDEEEELTRKIFNKNVKSLIFTDDNYKKEFDELLKSNFERLESFYGAQNRKISDPQIALGTTDEYLKVKKCCDEIVNYANKNNFKYDIICRVRPDIGWLNRLDLSAPISPDKLYISNYELHDCSNCLELRDTNLFPYIDASFFYGSQDMIHKLCTGFSEHMYDTLELCHESHDLSLAQEKILAKYLLDNKYEFNLIDRLRMSRYYVDWRKSPNTPLMQKYFGEIPENSNTYFDRIGDKDIVMDDVIVLK
jgi:hypothetical protein